MTSEPVDRGRGAGAAGHPALRPLIGLGVPVVLVVGTMPLLSTLREAPLGVPLALWWLGGCIPLTSACLAVVWFVFDRHTGTAADGCGDHAHDRDVP